VGTVSRVLNDSPLVSDATRERVQEVIAELGYRPSTVARALSLGKSMTVAVIAPFFTRPSVVLRLRGLVEAMNQSDYDLVLYAVETPVQRDERFELASGSDRFAGVVVMSLAVDTKTLERLRRTEGPVVFIDRKVSGLPHVFVDDAEGGRLATRHLIDLGHERIAFIGDDFDEEFGFTSSADRGVGYRRALNDAGRDVRPEYFRLAEHGREAATAITSELLGLPNRPTAIFAASDLQAFGVLEAARSAGVRVPEELSVIGFDDIEVSPYLGLTTIRQPLYDSGRKGAEVLMGAISGDDHNGPPSIEMPLELLVRKTTAPPA
jgi:DNA-binding LacI/PurR family transcriptional regulator